MLSRNIGQYLVISIGIIIASLLFLNLITTEQMKRMNYVSYLRMKPQIATENVTTKGTCARTVENPEYTAYAKKYIDPNYGVCMNQAWHGTLPLKESYKICDTEHEKILSTFPPQPQQTIIASVVCERISSINYWFQIFEKKLFITKTETVKAKPSESFTSNK